DEIGTGLFNQHLQFVRLHVARMVFDRNPDSRIHRLRSRAPQYLHHALDVAGDGSGLAIFHGPEHGADDFRADHAGGVDHARKLLLGRSRFAVEGLGGWACRGRANLNFDAELFGALAYTFQILRIEAADEPHLREMDHLDALFRAVIEIFERGPV